MYPHRGTLAAELLGVLLAYDGEWFAPGELVPTLRSCPTWQQYLAEFEAGRGQSAAVGRYLNEQGLTKSGHHRTRGSLYSSQATLALLQELLEEYRRERQQQLAAQSPADAPAFASDEAPQPGVEAVLVMAAQAGASGDAPTPFSADRRASAGASSVADAGSEAPQAPDDPQRRRDDRRAAAPGRPGPAIGWRRRATDLSRSPRKPQAAAAPAAVALPPQPNYGGAPAGAGMPPVWAGGGSSVGAYGYPGGLAPYAAPPEFGLAGADQPGLPLAFYWTQIRRHLFKILLGTVVITTLTAVYMLKVPKRYDSVVTLRMDFKAPAIQADASNNPAFDPATLIHTEVTDVTQRGVILDAIHNAHLDQDANLLKQIPGGAAAIPTPLDPDARNDALVDLISDQTTAHSPEDTHNIDIHFESLDPNTSATVANALAQALIYHEFQTRQQEQNDLLQFMTQQFGDIKARMEREQAALTQYQHQNNLLNPDGQSSLESNTLNTLNGSFLAAQAVLTKYQAEEQILKSGQVTDALLASDDGQVLRPSYDAWRAAELKFDQAKATRGAANPEYQAAQAAVATTRAQLNTAIQSVKNQINSQYQQARDQERLVAQQLAAARGAAQAFNDKAIDYDTQKRDLDADQKLYDDLQAQIKQQQLTSSLSSSGLRVTNVAIPDSDPVYPRVRYNVMLALLFSLFGGCALAVLSGYLDRSFTSPDGVEQFLRVPLLGALPELGAKEKMLELADDPPQGHEPRPPRSPFAESILMLRTAVLYAAPQGLRTFSITSAQPQEGKSAILANLAVALALHGAKVLLVDGDIRRPSQHRLFEIPNQFGLSNLLRQNAPLEDCFRATTVEKLYLMPAGPAVANPSELVATMLAQVLAPLTAEFDYVLVDSPPVLGFADAVSIATAVEATLLVTRAGKTPREMVQAALQPLQRVRARVLGVVLNQVSSSMSPYYSYFRDHYAAYYGHREAEEKS